MRLSASLGHECQAEQAVGICVGSARAITLTRPAHRAATLRNAASARSDGTPVEAARPAPSRR